MSLSKRLRQLAADYRQLNPTSEDADMLIEAAGMVEDAERYQYLRSQALYEGSSDWTIEVHGKFATIEEAIDAARAGK